ncbi:Rv2253/PknI dimerization domain-containing protein [Mycolicibacterium stellerae]|uniref:hypothetical protein n=1 Tax=Mycolicibacterium stellerae TaxID=2358193 RepID=UPI001F387DF5|nr:hypothetical protein [Mycolicibacterium stellerae]
MRLARLAFGTAVALLVSAFPADADPGDGIALNGAYTAFSDGVWAKTNSSYHDERSVTQTWTITSACSTYQDCTGRVTSDQGWSADMVYMSGSWRVRRTVDNWEPCIDGTATPGEQTFTFWKGYPDAFPMMGFDTTLGRSGACGWNKQLNVRLPFTLTPVA